MAPRVLEMKELLSLSEETQAELFPSAPPVHRSTVIRFTKEAAAMGLFHPVRSGLWLNMMAFPEPSPAEAAQKIRSGAVVSLHTVLGDAGVLNNFTTQVFAIIPNRKNGTNPATGTVNAGGTLFHFRSMPEEVLHGGDRFDRLVSIVPYPRATAEAALVHWFYLAKSKTSTLKLPDTQCDVSELDEGRIERLGSIAGVRDDIFEWMELCRQREHDDDEQIGWTHG